MRQFSVLILVLAVIFLSACPKPWMLSLYNNTAEDLTLVLPDGHLDWDAATKVEIVGTATTRSSGLHWVTDAHGNEVAELIVRRDGSLVRYVGVDYVGLANAYVDHSGAAIKQWLQLEPDGLLYLVRPGTSLPVRPLPPQPSGYPLKGNEE